MIGNLFQSRSSLRELAGAAESTEAVGASPLANRTPEGLVKKCEGVGTRDAERTSESIDDISG